MGTFPLAIGGVGGSGTRVVAQIFQEAGLYIGSDLSRGLDNLWFTLLLKRPVFYWRGAQFERALAAFVNAMEGRRPRDWKLLVRATVEMALYGHDYYGNGSGLWAFRRCKSICFPSRRGRWGWKEPNTHLFLSEIADAIPELRYVHLIRHGLDMAYSKNLNQLYTWGPFFGIPRPESGQHEHLAALEYWVRANERAIQIGQELMPERFHICRFDSLIEHPEQEIKGLLAFAKLDYSNRFTEIPKRPKSMGRYKQHDLGEFGDALLQRVKALGFES